MAGLLTLGVILGAAGGIVGAAVDHEQQKQQAETAERNAELQQQQMEYNQRMAEREATALEAENAENVRRMRQEAEALRSQRIAMLGKSGAAMSSGSPLAILGEAAADEELAIQDAHYSGSRQVAALRSKATDYRYGATIARSNVNAAKAAKPGIFGLAANVTGTVGDSLLTYARQNVKKG